MNERASFQNGVQFAWDATSLTAFSTCPRLYQYQILEGWEPAMPNAHLAFGGHYASAIESYFKQTAKGTDHEAAVRDIVRATLCATWDTAEGKPQDWLHNAKTRENLIRSIIWYLDEMAEDDTMAPMNLADGTPAVELSFSLDLGQFLWCGHLDRLAIYCGDPYVMDQKTSGSTITNFFFEGFKPSHQMAGYTLAGQIAFNTPVKGVVIDAAQIAVGFTRFERGFTTFTHAELEEWVETAAREIAIAQSLTSDYLDGKNMPMNPTSCHHYGGCRFRSVCSRSPEVRDNFLRADFKKRERLWDPLERR